jgi:GntR family transcriptional regulator, transcriptional repressor for pyruvate dehydrogenase complex
MLSVTADKRKLGLGPFETSVMRSQSVIDRADTEDRREPLSQRLYRDLGERISRGEFAVGDKLPTEQQIGQAYGVSRAVVREAISSLKAEGVVRPRQGVGVFVLGARSGLYPIAPSKPATLKDTIDLLEVRIGIECEAAALAALRRSQEQLDATAAAIDGMDEAIRSGKSPGDWDLRFHRTVAAMTDNPQFQILFDMFGEQLLPRTYIGIGISIGDGDGDAMREYLARINLEHRAVLAAISRRDAETARAAMRMHLSNMQVRLRTAYAARK